MGVKVVLEMTDNEILLKILNKVENIESRTQRLEVLLENDIPKQIQLIAEQHGDIVAKLDAIADYPETRGRVSTLENVVTTHTREIQALKEKAV